MMERVRRHEASIWCIGRQPRLTNSFPHCYWRDLAWIDSKVISNWRVSLGKGAVVIGSASPRRKMASAPASWKAGVWLD